MLERTVLPRYMMLLAEYACVSGHIGEAGFGIETLDGMIERCDRTGERWYLPELIRLRGELLLAEDAVEARQDAEAAFTRAMALAAEQGARSWELRAATSLARLRSREGDARGARDVLGPVLSAFNEGFGTEDLIAAAALLAEA